LKRQSSEVKKSDMSFEKSKTIEEHDKFKKAKDVEVSQQSQFETKQSSNKSNIDITDSNISGCFDMSESSKNNWEDFKGQSHQVDKLEMSSEQYQITQDQGDVKESKSFQKSQLLTHETTNSSTTGFDISESISESYSKSHANEQQCSQTEKSVINLTKNETIENQQFETNKSVKKSNKDRNLETVENVKVLESSSAQDEMGELKMDTKITQPKDTKITQPNTTRSEAESFQLFQTEMMTESKNIDRSDSSENVSVNSDNLKRLDSTEEQSIKSISNNSSQASRTENKKSSKKKNKNRNSSDMSTKNIPETFAPIEIKHEVSKTQDDSMASVNVEETHQSSQENKKSSKKKNKKRKSLPDQSNNKSDTSVMPSKSEVSPGLATDQNRSNGNNETTEGAKQEVFSSKFEETFPDKTIVAIQSESAKKISVIGQHYETDKSVSEQQISLDEEFKQEKTIIKKDSKGFFSEEERKEFEEENPLVKAIKEFQAQSSCDSTQSEVSSHILSDEQISNEVQYSELEKQIIKKSLDAQETIKSALDDIEKPQESSWDRKQISTTQVGNSHLIDSDNKETIKVQKHSLSIQDGVLIEQTTTERICNVPEDLSGQIDSQSIDPENLKNVDGQAKQRKGSSRFSKRQSSKSKSPSYRDSFSGPEEKEEEGETVSSTDLTTRLEETNVRMKKLSEVFSTICDQPGVEASPEMIEKQTRTRDTDRTHSEDEESQTSFHPLTRTTQVMKKECPLDEVIQTMIQKPENISSSSQLSSSMETTPTSPLMYKAVVTQHLEEKDECQDEDLL